MKYARFVNDIAVEFFTPPEGFTIEQCFHPDVVKQFEPVEDTFQLGDSKIIVEPNTEEIVTPTVEDSESAA